VPVAFYCLSQIVDGMNFILEGYVNLVRGRRHEHNYEFWARWGLLTTPINKFTCGLSRGDCTEEVWNILLYTKWSPSV
jgi:hypothetical protein